MLPRLIKEAIFQARIALHELNNGKIYGGVLETHLSNLAKITKEELNEIILLGNKRLEQECTEVFQKARNVLEILKKYESIGLTEDLIARKNT